MKKHLPEYLIEALCLGLFMISACTFATLLEYPGSALHRAIPDAFIRRMLMGIAMGLTAVFLIYSPFGKRSGAHMNPAVTLAFFRLGKVEKSDASFYILAQFIGGIAGTLLFTVLFAEWAGHPAVNYVVTIPGSAGPWIAFVAEVAISFLLMLVVLNVSNTPSTVRFTGLFAGFLVATYITLEAPISGMSMNPARTFGSAFIARLWTALWIYFLAPPIGMLLASEVYLKRKGAGRVFCAKLNHFTKSRCIFRCNFAELLQEMQRKSVLPTSIEKI